MFVTKLLLEYLKGLIYKPLLEAGYISPYFTFVTKLLLEYLKGLIYKPLLEA